MKSELGIQGRLMAFGIAGLAGAALTGIGESLLHFVPGGQYADPSYSYFAKIPESRLFVGHFISIAAAPLYLAGYWHLTGNLLAERWRARLIVFAMSAYAFIAGIVWIGQRAFLGLTVQSVDSGRADSNLLAGFSALNEPLLNVLRIGVLGFSIVWVLTVASGRTPYPRWMALLCPAILIALVFGVYAALLDAGSWLVPTALNVAHVILFSASLLMLRSRAAS